VRAVEFAGLHGLLLSIKGGGHNIAGTSVAEGALTLDMSRMSRVEVDVDASLVRVGPGCTLGDVDRATQEHGLATVFGFISETGVAGLTLGGGFGYLTRRFGWTVDNLEAVEIVTADCHVRHASRSEHEDMFWAARGGGGNFGVITDFTYRTHRVGPSIIGGLVAWSAESADEVLDMYRRVTAVAPREMTLGLAMRLAPVAPFVPPEWQGKPVIAVVVCHTGDPARAALDLAGIRGLGHPVIDLITTKTYAQQQCSLDATLPRGLHYYWKSEFVAALSDSLLQSFREQAADLASPMSQATLFHLAGALNEREVHDGAVGNRDAAYVCAAAGAWLPGDPKGAEHQSWVRTTWDTIRPHSTGGNYINFQTEDEDADRMREAYGRTSGDSRR
jgi:FAD binding domain-containing protein